MEKKQKFIFMKSKWFCQFVAREIDFFFFPSMKIMEIDCKSSCWLLHVLIQLFLLIRPPPTSIIAKMMNTQEVKFIPSMKCFFFFFVPSLKLDFPMANTELIYIFFHSFMIIQLQLHEVKHHVCGQCFSIDNFT